MGCINLIVGARALRNVFKVYVDIVNAKADFVEPTPPTNIITNNAILNQYNIKQGIEVFKKSWGRSVKKFYHFHYHKVFDPKKPHDLTYWQRRKSLDHLMFLKLKNDEVTIKGRWCAYGRNQRNWLSKDDTTYPTMSTEGLILSCVVDAMEGWDVATSNITGSFLQTDYVKEDIHIKMEG